MKRGNIPENEVLKAIRNIEKLVGIGWSIVYAKSLCCGNTSTRLHKEVNKHPSYLPILNSYMKKIGKTNQYSIRSGQLLPVKK